MKNKNILVVDDEKNICRSIELCLTSEGYNVQAFCTPHEALANVRKNDFDAAIIDIRLGDKSGIELFSKMRQENLDVPVIFISGNASLDEAAQSLKLGAFDFIEKPFNAEKLIVTVKNCVTYHELKERVDAFEKSQTRQTLLGDHKLVTALRKNINKVALSDAAVLIRGESGTGKELIAQAIHQQSQRANYQLVTVNCSAIPESLIDSALFGHVKGAFTGAEHHKKGYFELAENGTLFLDEVADMPLSAQASLLRVLENKEIQKVGAERVSKVNVRLVAASHKNLSQLVDQGLFREDLYYRLNVIPLTSPALRERKSDIPLLVNHFVNLLCKKHGFSDKKVTANCLTTLSRYDWPGNIRELLNTVERMLILGGDTLTKDDIPEEIFKTNKQTALLNEGLSLKSYRQKMEREYLIAKLHEFDGNISRVAKSLEVDRSYLHKKLNQYEIKRENIFD